MENNKTIRLSAVTAIKAYANIADSHVHNSKITPHLIANLPAVGVYIASSTAEGINHIDPGFTRTFEITIECAVKGTEATYADECDDLLYEIKQALFVSSTWKDNFENIAGYQESIVLEDVGEEAIALATLTIQVQIVEKT